MTHGMVVESRKPPQWFLIRGPLIATLLAFVMRLHDLGGKELWYDEAVSGFLLLQSWLNIILYRAQCRVMPHDPLESWTAS